MTLCPTCNTDLTRASALLDHKGVAYCDQTCCWPLWDTSSIVWAESGGDHTFRWARTGAAPENAALDLLRSSVWPILAGDIEIDARENPAIIADQLDQQIATIATLETAATPPAGTRTNPTPPLGGRPVMCGTITASHGFARAAGLTSLYTASGHSKAVKHIARGMTSLAVLHTYNTLTHQPTLLDPSRPWVELRHATAARAAQLLAPTAHRLYTTARRGPTLTAV